MIAPRITPPDAPPDRGRRSPGMSHYTRLLVARRGRPEHVAELEAMAATMELAYRGGPLEGAARHLPPAMLARLEQIEAIPAAPLYADLGTPPRPASDLDPPTCSAGSEPAAPEPRPSGVRPVPSIDVWATSAHAWGCGCTHPAAGECATCAGSCLCHVGAVADEHVKEASNG